MCGVFLAEFAATPLFLSPMGDEANFHQTALSLNGLGSEVLPFLYQPLYSFYLALVYRIIGANIFAVKILQLFLGLGCILVCYGLGRELAGRAVGRIAAVFASLYGPQVFFEGQLLDPVLCVPLFAGSLWCLIAAGTRRRPWLLLPAGTLMGLCLMGRPNLLLVLPVVGLWLMVQPWTWWSQGAGAGLFILALGLGLLPSWIHNARSGESFVLVSSSGGHSFFIGNNSQATGGFHVPRWKGIDASSHEDYRKSLTDLAERGEGRSLTPSEVSSYWYQQGFAFWREQPGSALLLAGKKLLLALNADERPIHLPYVFGREIAPVLRFLPGFALVFPFALVGLLVGGRKTWEYRLLVLSGVAYLATLLILYVPDRYRILVLPILWPLAGIGILELRDRFRQGGRQRVGVTLLVLLAAYGLTQVPLTSEFSNRKSITTGYNLMGKAEGDRGDLAAAERYFRRAIETAGPGHGAVPLMNLGVNRELIGDLSGAFELYRQSAAADSQYRPVRERLALLSERQGDIGQAILWWREIQALSADPSRAAAEIERLSQKVSK